MLRDCRIGERAWRSMVCCHLCARLMRRGTPGWPMRSGVAQCSGGPHLHEVVAPSYEFRRSVSLYHGFRPGESHNIEHCRRTPTYRRRDPSRWRMSHFSPASRQYYAISLRTSTATGPAYAIVPRNHKPINPVLLIQSACPPHPAAHYQDRSVYTDVCAAQRKTSTSTPEQRTV